MRNNIDKRAGLSGDKTCVCGTSIQDIDHYLLECPVIASERKDMLDKIEQKALELKGINLSHIDTPLLLGQTYDLPKQLQLVITSAVCGFIGATADKFTI